MTEPGPGAGGIFRPRGADLFRTPARGRFVRGERHFSGVVAVCQVRNNCGAALPAAALGPGEPDHMRHGGRGYLGNDLIRWNVLASQPAARVCIRGPPPLSIVHSGEAEPAELAAENQASPGDALASVDGIEEGQLHRQHCPFCGPAARSTWAASISPHRLATQRACTRSCLRT